MLPDLEPILPNWKLILPDWELALPDREPVLPDWNSFCPIVPGLKNHKHNNISMLCILDPTLAPFLRSGSLPLTFWVSVDSYLLFKPFDPFDKLRADKLRANQRRAIYQAREGAHRKPRLPKVIYCNHHARPDPGEAFVAQEQSEESVI
jgi:hypothetical protein